ncbi:MAG TPA: high-affinity branched-chain amino acid ABC transporter permease LivM [Aestuariivirgaceae bacterium]|jgi:branched-chain amino acid transport system permease protein
MAIAEAKPITHSRALDLPAIVKDCLLATLVTFAIAFPTLGIKTDSTGGLDIILRYRWSAVFIACAVVFAGRLLLHVLVWNRSAAAAAAPSALAERLTSLELGRYLGPAVLALAVVMPFMPFTDRYVMDVAILIVTYIMLAWGLQVVVGLAGLLDLGYVAFYAVGAYSYALLAQHFGFSFWICLPLAGILAAFWGIILGFPVLRLRGDYLAIVTLAFGEIIRLVLLNWHEFTGGPNGLSNVPRPSFFGIPFSRGEDGFAATFGLEFSNLHRLMFLYYLAMGLALVTFFVTNRLRKLPIGRAWEALREDEVACRSLGLNTTNTKLTAFAIGAMFGGFAGSFFATKQGFISPESFNFLESATILAIVVLGGMSSQIGVVLASVVMIGGLEVLRQLHFLKLVFGADFDPSQLRMLLFGMAMVLVMLWKPRGLVSSREPSVFLKEKKTVSSDLVSQGRG